MTVLAVDGLVVVGAVTALVLLAFLVVVGIQQRGSNDAFLEWDPVRRTEWQYDQESVDMEEMLALHNAERARRGERALTLAEYAEVVRRDGHA